MADEMEERIRLRAYQLWEEEGSPEGREDEFWHRARAEIRREERQYDSADEDSFPASDPPSTSGITGPS